MFALVLSSLSLICGQSQPLFGATTIPTGCGNFQYPNATIDVHNPPDILQAAFYQVDAYLESISNLLHLPSISYGIVYDQQLVYYKSIGYSNIVTKTKPTPDTIYRIGSISKSFTVLLAYILRDKGILNMDDPISKFNDNFIINNPWGISKDEKLGKTITIRQLASQIAGLPRTSPCTFGQGNGNDSQLCINSNTSTILNRLAQEYLLHPTDLQPSYSNLAYAVIGNLISEYINQTYEKSLYEHVLKPLNLSNTGLNFNSNQVKYAADGYELVDGKIIPLEYADLGWESPAGQIFSSVNDMVKLIAQIFASYPNKYEINSVIMEQYPYLVTPSTFREYMRPMHINPDGQSMYGTPWQMQMINNELLKGKDGNVNGFSTDIELLTSMKLGVIGFTNLNGVDGTILTYPIMEILIPAFKSWLMTSSSYYQPLLPPNPNVFVGDYVLYYSNTTTIIYGPIYVRLNTYFNNKEWLIMSYPSQAISGVLIYDKSNVNSNSNVKVFRYYSLTSMTESCWLQTLMAEDGQLIKFYVDNSGQNVIAVQAPDLLYGYNLTKMGNADMKYNPCKIHSRQQFIPHKLR